MVRSFHFLGRRQFS